MSRAAVLLAALGLEVAFFAWISGAELNGAYFRSYAFDLLAQSAPLLLLGFGMTLILMIAGIDLSAASMVALVSCVMSSFSGGAGFWWQALPAGLATGLLAGGLNGLLIARLDVPPIVATLGTMIFFRGLCFVVMGDLEKSPFLEVPGYEWLGQGWGGIALAAVVFGAGGFWFARSAWRRELLLLGGNRIAARYAGIPAAWRTAQPYVLMGFLAFLAALTFTARNGSVSASALSGFELHVIVAVVLGGTRVEGGAGTLLGTVFGVLFIAVLDEGLRGGAIWGARHLPFRVSHLEYLLMGLLLVGGVLLNRWVESRRNARV